MVNQALRCTKIAVE